MPIYHVSLSFARYSAAELDEFTSGVRAGLDGNPAFPNPKVSLADLAAAQLALQNALTAQAQGGPQATAAKNNAQDALINLLRIEANYVQLEGHNDLPTLLSSGFLVNSTGNATAPLETPGILALVNGNSTQLIVRGLGVDNARSYEAQIKVGNGAYQPAGTYPAARRMVLTGLVPGQVYTVQIRAVGGSTGYSDWSDPVSHMAM
jgi:hypothetical protein